MDLFLIFVLKVLLSAELSLSFAPSTAYCRLLSLPHLGQSVTLKLSSRENADSNEIDEDEEWIAAEISEVISNDEDDTDEEAWIPDREKARRARERVGAQDYQASQMNSQSDETDNFKSPASPYTEEEEEVIRAMGGMSGAPSKRIPGYLGDCTLHEISMDYSVPVCYLADVLCMWGVQPPINIHDRLGDLVTGEQAFAILEAINTLDVAALHDRYSNQSLLSVCNDWDIDVAEGFEMAMKEGWSLPFGVQTVLRVEQEEELLRVLGSY